LPIDGSLLVMTDPLASEPAHPTWSRLYFNEG